MRSPSALHQHNRDIGFFKSTKDFFSYLPPKLGIYCEARVIRLECFLVSLDPIGAFLNKVWDYCSRNLDRADRSSASGATFAVVPRRCPTLPFQDHVACRKPESTRSGVSPVLETREEKQTQSHHRHGYSQLNRAPASSSVVKMVGLPDFTCPSSGSPFVFLFCSSTKSFIALPALLISSYGPC